MKTLLLNPPSFEGFDGGASSRWPATREIESYWYPVWLGYPAALIKESRLLDAPPHHVGPEETISISADYEFVVLFTSSAGFQSDVRLAEAMQLRQPSLKIAFVGPPVTIEPEKSLRASEAIDFVTHKEFDYSVRDFAAGKSLDEIPGVHFLREGKMVSTTPLPPIEHLDELPWVSPIYNRDLDFTRYNVPFLLHPYISFYTTRGCPAKCTFCLWPQTFDGHPWRQRSPQDVANEVEYALSTFKGLKEIFFDDDTFTIRKDRILAMCKVFKPLKFTWSCTSRVHVHYETLRAMKDAGCRLFIVGFESADDQILKNIKKVPQPSADENLPRIANEPASGSMAISSLACPARPERPFRRRSSTPRSSIAKRSRFRWLTRTRAPSFTAIFSRTTSSPKMRWRMPAGISFRWPTSLISPAAKCSNGSGDSTMNTIFVRR